MIVVTGGAGFIGSCLVWRLNQLGIEDIIIVDKFTTDDKWKNLISLKYEDVFDANEFGEMVSHDFLKKAQVDTIFHLGAISSTTEKDFRLLMSNNYEYTKYLCEKCLTGDIKFIYASSAATYGMGEQGYSDNENVINSLRPLNGYGFSKQMFDKWLYKNNLFDKVVGLKYFNVFGPNEYHKEDMRSIICKGFEQIKSGGGIKLFKSDKPEYADGEQKRDFIYVKDAVDMTLFFWENKPVHGLYNIGSGKASSWNEFVTPVFKALGIDVKIEYFEMPENLKSKYQYFTEADISKIRKAGYKKEITKLEDAVFDYVTNYMNTDFPYLH
ncbi:MAG TPA: ADP-glyceromanno-heptose 6-epimerase [Bacteroidetes bacterium]|nr:ADP-glyceromanno-heptose 6-epimerase [Ignavibacteria bacterium]HCA42354.1 ADP-glyceromanno-heptose 6-epimerase [Bacteroidota bacterium]HCN36276.1 ADP-glyceromanno-heptose 6-epimerase [Bacteroidota bacterium]